MKKNIGIENEADLKNYMLEKTATLDFEDLAKDVVGFLNSLNQEIHVYQEGVFAQIRPILEDYLFETLIFLLESSEHDDACLDVFSIEGETIFSKTTDFWKSKHPFSSRLPAAPAPGPSKPT